jgi:phosphoribosyl 1,2-cyclic phosphodiesterase
MAFRLCILGSGSAGNAAWLSTPGFDALLDFGFPERELRRRLTEAGGDWDRIDTLIVSHLHTDHLHPQALNGWLTRAGRRRLFIHAGHEGGLRTGRSFQRLRRHGCVAYYEPAAPLTLADGLTMTPLPLSHDAEPTFGFRFDYSDGGGRVSAAIVTDLGRPDEALTAAVADVDLLGIEFNHDLRMLADSGRPRSLIERIRSDRGHLSNQQAAAWLERILAASGNGGPGTLLLLHLSRECNTPGLARTAADAVLERRGASPTVVAARQDRPDRVRTVAPRPVQGVLFNVR